VTVESTPATVPNDVAPVVLRPCGRRRSLRALREQLFAQAHSTGFSFAHDAGRSTIDAADAYLIVGRPDLANGTPEKTARESRGASHRRADLGLVWGIVKVAVTFDNGTHRFLKWVRQHVDRTRLRGQIACEREIQGS
jgi:hypothetical protein